ncbi:MAG TPA: YbhB/YbcL family Raf kinase inhibitor-like protein [Gemmatimonadaceae bacterium]
MTITKWAARGAVLMFVAPRNRVVPLILLLTVACGGGKATDKDTTSSAPPPASNVDTSSGRQTVSLEVTSTAFKQAGVIPGRYTCEGDDTSPPLAWSGAPAGTKSFAMIVDDPDAPDPAKPQRVYVHWVIYGLPANATGLPENASKKGMPAGANQGKNDFGKQNYGGPCPPIGRHRYFFKLYALDTEPTFASPPTKADLLKAIEGHVIAQGELMGTYQKGDAK